MACLINLLVMVSDLCFLFGRMFCEPTLLLLHITNLDDSETLTLKVVSVRGYKLGSKVIR